MSTVEKFLLDRDKFYINFHNMMIEDELKTKILDIVSVRFPNADTEQLLLEAQKILDWVNEIKKAPAIGIVRKNIQSHD